MRRAKGRSVRTYYQYSLARRRLPSIQQIGRKYPGMPRRNSIGSLPVNPYSVQDSSLIRGTLAGMVAKPLLLLSFVFSACVLAQTPQFTIQDLGTLPNLLACTGTGLSQSGNVVGYCAASAVSSLITNPQIHGFLYSNGKIADLNLTSQPTPVPFVVNDAGVVAGAYTNVNIAGPSISATPFVVQNGEVSLPSGPMQNVLPLGLNNAGQLAGSSVQISGNSLNFFLNTKAVIYTVVSGATTTLTAPTGLGAGAAFGLNANGDVAGAAVGQNATAITPLLWPSGKAANQLPILPGYPQSEAVAVNDSGLAAGAAFSINFSAGLKDPNATGHAVLFNTDGTVTDLGVLSGDISSFATGINNSGSVVGFSSSQRPDFTLQLAPAFEAPTPSVHAFLYAKGKMYDLTTLLTNGTGWKLAYATAINNAGQITGTGIFQGTSGGPEQHAFLLTPAAPSTAPAITGIGGVGGSVPAVTTISANGLIAIFGSNFATTPSGINSGNILNNELPTNLSNTCVESNGTKWGLFFVSSGQINALAGTVPTSGTVPVSVVTNCGTGNEVVSPVMNVPVAPVSPEFLYFVQNADGNDPVAALDFTTAVDVGSQAPFAPAKVGDVIIAYGVGWGTTNPAAVVGTLASGAASLTNKISVTLGGVPVDVTSSSFYAGLSPGSAGLYQMNFVVPPGVPAGNQALVLTVDGVASPAKAYLTIGN